MKYLVTGGCGFIGSNYILQLLKHNPDAQVHNIDALTYAGNPKNLESIENDPRYTFREMDITDEAIWCEIHSFGPDIIVHFAAESHVDRSIECSYHFIKTNVSGTDVLLRAALMVGGVKKFIHVSTDEVYGQIPAPHSSVETDALDPRSPYSASKAASDLLALSYYTTHGLPVIVTRCCLTGDTRIPVLIDNCQYNKSISELVSLVSTSKNIYVKGMDTQTKDIKWQRVLDAFETKSIQPILKITTRYGRSVSLTDDHIIFRMSADPTAFTSLPCHRKQPRLVEEVKAGNIKVGDKIAVCAKAYEGDIPLLELDISSFIQRNQMKKVKIANREVGPVRAHLKEWCLKMGKDFGSTRYRCNQNKSIPFEVANDIASNDRLYISKKASAIPAKIQVDDNVLWLLGFILAEGCIQTKNNRDYFISLSSDECFIDKAVNIINQYFELPAHKAWDYNNVPYCVIRSKILVLFLRDLLSLTSSKKTQISSYIYNLPNKQLRAVLQGFFEGDGLHFGKSRFGSKHSKCNKFSISTASKDFAVDILELLLRFDCWGSFQEKRVKFKNKEYDAFQVEVYGLTNLEPQYWNDSDNQDLQYIKSNKDNQIVWTHVTKIESCEDTTEVYDLTIEEAHNFATTTGILVHNCNNYGPRQYPEKLIPLFVTNLLEGKNVPVYGNGEQVREWIHVNDHNRAIDHIIEHGKVGEIYNIGSGVEKENLDTTMFILHSYGLDENQIDWVADRKGHDKRYSIDCTKLRNLGWAPAVNFESGLNDTIKWYEKNEEWWEPLKNTQNIHNK